MVNLIIKLFGLISFNIGGWSFENKLPKDVKKYVLLAAPHTSNWDMYYALVCFRKMGIPVRFAIKDSWLKFPFKRLMLSLGAIGVDRSAGPHKKSLVDAVVDLYNKHEELVLCITPEGTRKLSPKWKTGFYHIATKANIPIAVGTLDYKNKKASILKFIYPCGDLRKDLTEMAGFYNAEMARYPEKFAIDIEGTLSKGK